MSGGGLFDEWEHTKREFLVTTGFRLSDETELVLTYEVRFSQYAGRGNSGFGVKLTVSWSLGAEVCRWETTIDGRPESDLTESIPYAALAGPPDGLDEWTARACRLMMDAVGRKSGTQE